MYRLTAAALDLLPERGRGALLEILARTQFAVSRGRRRNVERNIAGAGIVPSAAAVLEIFRNHARTIAEMFTSSRRTTEEIREGAVVEGLDAIDEALAQERGVILVTVHVGNWEFGALYLSALGYRLHVVAGVQMNRLLTGALREFKERMGMTVVNPEDSYRKLYRALEANGIVALLLDGDIFRDGSEAILFGRRVKLPGGAVRLARGTGAPIIGAYCRNADPRRHVIHIEPIVGAGEIAALSDAEVLERLSRTAERFIGANYDQWCIFRDFWGAPH